MGKYCKEMCHFPKYGYGGQKIAFALSQTVILKTDVIAKKISSKSK